MNCWKSINLNKEFGLKRLYFLSFFIGLLAFIFMYVPVSIKHGEHHVNESGTLFFLAALILLPIVHTAMHILPLLFMNKRVKLKYQVRYFPCITYYTHSYLTRKASLFVALFPTFVLTIPGIAAGYAFPEYDAWILILSSIHIGISFSDFVLVKQIIQAPKRSVIESGKEGIDILLKIQQ